MVQLGLKLTDGQAGGFDFAQHGQTDITFGIDTVRLVHDLIHFGSLDHELIVRPQQVSGRNRSGRRIFQGFRRRDRLNGGGRNGLNPRLTARLDDGEQEDCDHS